MGLSRAFTQQGSQPTFVAANQFPNVSTLSDLQLTPTPTMLPGRSPANNRRGVLMDNDGTLPVVFAFGTTVSFSARTGILFPNDFYEDLSGWQGPIALASVGGNGAVNITEVVYI